MNVRFVAALCSAVTAGLLAGCSTTESPTATPAGTAAVPTSDSAQAAPQSAAGRCHTADLRIAVDTTGQTPKPGQQATVFLTMENTSKQACTLYGYPGVHLTNTNKQLDVADWDLPRATYKDPVEKKIAPGESASTAINCILADEKSNQSTLFVPRDIQITPPDETTSATVRWPYAGLSYDGGATHPGTYVFPVGVTP
ncbi:DUF4232 domain-containing protein [Nocardia sp. NPDC049149]|uniref:DUF4232 domain-containing protein n=1 Tax=Nocardia sp. NPDC049149 TaxID=3364315 RepID=UPI003720616D